MAYDGTRYAGFQVQPGVPTVQGELERALARLCREPVRVTGSGRTDAGVHAIGQVISFRTASALDGATMARGVNALLPDDIAVSALEPAADDFHARFSAMGRTYEYRIRNAAQRSPLERHREHWHPGALDDGSASAAAAALLGRHDFSAFAAGPGGEREVRSAAWTREGDLVRFEIAADAFLRGMVRAIVGTLLQVARGKRAADEMAGIVVSRDRGAAGPSAPAKGLCLLAVEYGESTRSGGERERDEDE